MKTLSRVEALKILTNDEKAKIAKMTKEEMAQTLLDMANDYHESLEDDHLGEQVGSVLKSNVKIKILKSA